MSTKKKGKPAAESKSEEKSLLNSIREGYDLPEAYFKVEVSKAASKKDVATVLNLEQLTGNRFENFYVDTDKTRDTNTISSLEQLLKDPLNPYNKLLFSGFTGSGKTTELTS
jgi:chromosomal replication initiation ATPase DnaA